MEEASSEANADHGTAHALQIVKAGSCLPYAQGVQQCLADIIKGDIEPISTQLHPYM